MMAALRQEPALALDTESDSLYRYFYRVCLIQISLPDIDYLVTAARATLSRRALLADPAREGLSRGGERYPHAEARFRLRFANLFDTMVGLILGWRQVSLAAAEKHFGVTLDKRTQLTDWGQRPSASAARYAAGQPLPAA